jgi:hypothetical protein
LQRYEQVLRRRIDLLEGKLRTVLAFLDEERARLQRVRDLRATNLSASIEQQQRHQKGAE